MKELINSVVCWFERPLTKAFEVGGWVVIAAMYALIFWIILSMGGCSSFEKTTKYKPNTYWNGKGI